MQSPAWYRANGLRPPGYVAPQPVRPAPIVRAKPTPLDLKRARQVRYYERRKERGLCKTCPNHVEGDQTRCEECRLKRIAENAKRYRKEAARV